MATASAVSTEPVLRDHVAAGAVISSHTLQHLYGHAFWVILPTIYTALGLTPIAAGLVGSVRMVGSGVSSTVGGFLVDRLQHRRLMILYLSLAAMGLGYFLVGAAPTYVLILGALMVASIAGSIWHPTARGLLSQIYPRRRGFMISVDRSAGSVGDTAGPLLAGWLLAYLLWQQIFLAAFPLALLLMFLLWRLLRRSEAFQNIGARSRGEPRPVIEQLRELRGLFQDNGRILTLLITIKAVAGFGQGGLFLWLPLYLSESVGMDELGIGFHLALLTAMGTVTNPAFGYLSDRIGRTPVIILVLAAKMALAALIALSGHGIMLTVLIAALGAFNFVVNPLVQTWALDIAHGRKLEGTTLGVLDGANFIFTGIGPLMVGFVVEAWGFESLFWYIAAMSAAALVVVMFTLPFARAGWSNRY
ncbi:MAG: MFS transporter [Chloroflexota bacterium]|nr:MFS transporter [Chloroflexota bacterium]MDE2884104.1 MFS transporter [Chloroflexota bacterium]